MSIDAFLAGAVLVRELQAMLAIAIDRLAMLALDGSCVYTVGLDQ